MRKATPHNAQNPAQYAQNACIRTSSVYMYCTMCKETVCDACKPHVVGGWWGCRHDSMRQVPADTPPPGVFEKNPQTPQHKLIHHPCPTDQRVSVTLTQSPSFSWWSDYASQKPHGMPRRGMACIHIVPNRTRTCTWSRPVCAPSFAQASHCMEPPCLVRHTQSTSHSRRWR